MPRTHARPRRPVTPARARLLPWLGFRYSVGRDAYVLRVIGGRVGPVYQVNPGVQMRPVPFNSSLQEILDKWESDPE